MGDQIVGKIGSFWKIGAKCVLANLLKSALEQLVRGFVKFARVKSWRNTKLVIRVYGVR